MEQNVEKILKRKPGLITRTSHFLFVFTELLFFIPLFSTNFSKFFRFLSLYQIFLFAFPANIHRPLGSSLYFVLKFFGTLIFSFFIFAFSFLIHRYFSNHLPLIFFCLVLFLCFEVFHHQQYFPFLLVQISFHSKSLFYFFENVELELTWSYKRPGTRTT